MKMLPQSPLMSAASVQSLIGSVHKQSSGGPKPKSYKRKSLMDLLDQVRMPLESGSVSSLVPSLVMVLYGR